LHKAFDCVNHKISLAKLEYCGNAGKFLHIIKSYLEDISQKVSIHSNIHSDNISSDWKKITHDVPQGSMLGPLLFLIYVNDFPEVLIHNALLILFTEDTSVMLLIQILLIFNLTLK